MDPNIETNSTPEKRFAAVEFEDKSVEAVPCSWLNVAENKCRWPVTDSDLKRINKLIKKAAIPSEDWDTHDVRVLKKCGKCYIIIYELAHRYSMLIVTRIAQDAAAS